MDDPFDQPTYVSPSERYAAGRKLFGDRFLLERRVGRGGMGEVWLARDNELGSDVALKFLPPEVAGDKGAVARLRREAVAGQALSHPRTVKTFGFYVEGDEAAVAMAFVKGKTLSELQAETELGYFEASQIEPWLKDICDALDYAHGEVGIVHRDLKPQNIIIEAGTSRAMVMDFGIARRISETHTQLIGKDVSGTLAYSSPQQVDGEKSVPADDIYSLGATIYELLTGAPPFFRGDLRKQIGEKAPPIMQDRRDELIEEGMVLGGDCQIPEAWERAIAACLAKQRADRPGSGQNLVNRLDEKTLFSPFQVVVDEPEEDVGRGFPPAVGKVKAAGSGEANPVLDLGRASSEKLSTEAPLGGISFAKDNAAEMKQQQGDRQARHQIGSKHQQNGSHDDTRTVEVSVEIKKEGALRRCSKRCLFVLLAFLRNGVPCLFRFWKLALPVVVVLLLKYFWPNAYTEKDHVLADSINSQVLAIDRLEPFTNSRGQRMIYIPAGSFVMGSPSNEKGREEDEKQNKVVLTWGYWLGATEVTQGQWEAVMGSGLTGFLWGDEDPASDVSWEDAMEFCEKLTLREQSAGRLRKGMKYVLPTEAQWEYACRAGTQGAYAGDLDTMGWYVDNSSREVRRVGMKKANAWGLYDMHGNVLEWCLDWYAKDYKMGTGGRIDPVGPNTGEFRVMRGGWMSSGEDNCRSASRAMRVQGAGAHYIGFRLSLQVATR